MGIGIGIQKSEFTSTLLPTRINCVDKEANFIPTTRIPSYLLHIYKTKHNKLYYLLPQISQTLSVPIPSYTEWPRNILQSKWEANTSFFLKFVLLIMLESPTTLHFSLLGTPDMWPEIKLLVYSHLPEAGVSVEQLFDFSAHSTILSFLCWKVTVYNFISLFTIRGVQITNIYTPATSNIYIYIYTPATSKSHGSYIFFKPPKSVPSTAVC